MERPLEGIARVERNLNDLRERLAALEHEQWVASSKEVAETEKLTPERLTAWQNLWRHYDLLTEEEKDQARLWAGRVVALLREMNIIP